MRLRILKYSLLFICSLTSCYFIYAQDVEPRRWSSLPLESKFIGAGYGYTYGDVLFDPVLGVEDTRVQINSILVSYIQSFRIGEKLARFDVQLPVGFVNYNGLLNGVPESLNRRGFMDPRVRFSINLLGPPALNLKEFQEYFKEHPTNTTFGFSIAVTLPLGQYFEDKLINLGQNRFIFRPQLGFLHTWKNWSFELTGSVYLFTQNNNFFGDVTRKQVPLFAAQTHLIKRFPSRIWGSISMSLGQGGKSIINLIPNDDTRTDLMGAISVGYPIMKGQNIKLVYLRAEALSEFGADTNSFILGWSININ